MYTYSVDGMITDGRPMLVGAILDTTSEENRFLAMKQLFDIGMKRLKNPYCTIAETEFNLASAGAVCTLPAGNAAMIEQFPLELLWGKNQSTQYKPASVTKVMTAVTALPYIGNIGEKVTIREGDTEGGSGNYFNVGDVLTLRDLLYGMMLPSSNTCARTLAHYVGGKILDNDSATAADCRTAFLNEMNWKAAAMGCVGSYFDAPSGGSMTTLTTASDLVRIAIEACSCDELLKVWNKKSYDISIGGANPRTQSITTTVANATLEEDYYIIGGKTGHGITSGVHYMGLVMIATPK